MNPIPLREQVACVRREIAMRERVYPRWVAAERMTQEKADSELAAMRAVLETVEREFHKAEPELFS
jgi:hypothetical protein